MGPCCWGPGHLLTQEVAESCLLRGQACPSGPLRVLKVEKGGRGVLSQDTQPAPTECRRASHWAVQPCSELVGGAWCPGMSDPAPCCSLSSGAWEGSAPTPFCTASLLLREPGTDPVTAFILQGEGLPAKPCLAWRSGGGAIRRWMAGGNTEAGGTASVKSSHTPPRAWSPPGWRKDTQS